MHLKPKLKRVGNKVAHPTLASGREKCQQYWGFIIDVSKFDKGFQAA